jgi:hypothetical protein
MIARALDALRHALDNVVNPYEKSDDRARADHESAP